MEERSRAISCCKFCNYAKKNITFEEFITWIRLVNKNTENVVI